MVRFLSHRRHVRCTAQTVPHPSLTDIYGAPLCSNGPIYVGTSFSYKIMFLYLLATFLAFVFAVAEAGYYRLPITRTTPGLYFTEPRNFNAHVSDNCIPESCKSNTNYEM